MTSVLRAWVQHSALDKVLYETKGQVTIDNREPEYHVILAFQSQTWLAHTYDLCTCEVGTGGSGVQGSLGYIRSYKQNNQLFRIKGHHCESKKATQKTLLRNHQYEKDSIAELAFTTTKGPISQPKVSKGLDRPDSQ